ncbi:hypothetical protein HYV81_03025 [Candidatus Woesearchaeota archaeon]|nr:hypothetical protein [Candidatus Woesearchaeota archaeon]
MEQRKLIGFGKATFSVTLPKTWIRKNRLKKGDTLSVQETSRNSIEIIPKLEADEKQRSIDIEMENKGVKEVTRLLVSAYLNGYTHVTIKGSNAGKVQYIRKKVHELIAAEVMEVTSNTIVIHIFWDVKSLNLRSMINRIEQITKTIFKETNEMCDGACDIQDILEKSYEVQRQTLLAKRAITNALVDSDVAYKFNASSLELCYTAFLIHYLDKIAEYIAGMSKILCETNLLKRLSPKAKAEIQHVLEEVYNNYERALIAYNTMDESMANTVVDEFTHYDKIIRNIREKYMQTWMPTFCGYIRRIITKTRDIGFIVINLENAPK